jgi:hypothetical protein
MATLGVVVAVGAVVAYLFVATAGRTRPCLAVNHNVPCGAVIATTDRAVIAVNPAVGLQPIPATQRDQADGGR